MRRSVTFAFIRIVEMRFTHFYLHLISQRVSTRLKYKNSVMSVKKDSLPAILKCMESTCSWLTGVRFLQFLADWAGLALCGQSATKNGDLSAQRQRFPITNVLQDGCLPLSAHIRSKACVHTYGAGRAHKALCSSLVLAMELECSFLYGDRALLLGVGDGDKVQANRGRRHITERGLGGGGRETHQDIERHRKTHKD